MLLLYRILLLMYPLNEEATKSFCCVLQVSVSKIILIWQSSSNTAIKHLKNLVFLTVNRTVRKCQTRWFVFFLREKTALSMIKYYCGLEFEWIAQHYRNTQNSHQSQYKSLKWLTLSWLALYPQASLSWDWRSWQQTLSHLVFHWVSQTEQRLQPQHHNSSTIKDTEVQKWQDVTEVDVMVFKL